MKASVKRPALIGIALLAAALSANLASAANADEGVRTTVVSYSDLDLSQSRDVQRFYSRLRHAARTVCDNSPGSDLSLLLKYEACVARAVSDAASQVNSEQRVALRRADSQHLSE